MIFSADTKDLKIGLKNARAKTMAAIEDMKRELQAGKRHSYKEVYNAATNTRR